MPSAPTKKEIEELTQPAYIGIPSTIYTSGAPQLVPVRSTCEREHFYITTPAVTTEVTNIKNDPGVALCIADTSTERTSQAITAIGQDKLISYQKSISHTRQKIISTLFGARPKSTKIGINNRGPSTYSNKSAKVSQCPINKVHFKS